MERLIKGDCLVEMDKLISDGILAWCFNSIDKAMAKFDYINDKYEK